MPNIISWNVLFREYEKEYHPESKILKTYPNEEERVEFIVAMLKENSNEETILCLQECSSAICNVLTVTFNDTHRVFAYNIREDEHLVTVAPKEFEMHWAGSNQTSNGYLVIYSENTYIVNCHLIPSRYSSVSVLEYLRKFLDIYSGNVFIAGDFNENHKKVKEDLKGYYVCPYYGKTYKGKSIDHIIFAIDEIHYTHVLIKQEHLSDHHAISLTYEL